ncbi:hypothetical protein XBFM1_1620001 [Xenorhabdus bovienii str. feltiae Moldova]|uniref:Uncharacterized protein n=1 Tax=Xenorhabdus bovienii str. feltiae Moldova TaxID=1398200 RepID=A0A077NDW0_XENBV|nr:hypothetical protein XBFM1_1620001 [Xenorhabdus bovienii str. feltiae Moldova]
MWTVNFFSNGYKAHLYDYNYDDVVGIMGEAVLLNFCGDRRLSPGKVIFIREAKMFTLNIHQQIFSGS